MRSPCDVIFGHLSPYLGPHTARTALRTFAQRTLGIEPDAVTLDQTPRLIEGLRPTLRTLMGTERCDAMLAEVTRDLHM